MRSFIYPLLITLLGCSQAPKDEVKKPEPNSPPKSFSCYIGDDGQLYVSGEGDRVTYELETGKQEGVIEGIKFNGKVLLIPSSEGTIKISYKQEVCVGYGSEGFNTFSCIINFQGVKKKGCGGFKR